MALRYYQEDALMAVQLALEEYDRVLVNCPTGSGKTVLAAHLIGEFLPKRCIFLADQDELCQQPLTVIDREINVIPGLEKGKHRAKLTNRVIVASSQTLARKNRLEAYPHHFFDYAIIDEAHRGRKRDRAIVDHIAKKVIGITGTPFTSSLRDLSTDYEEVAYSLPMLDLIGDGFAPPYQVLRLPVEIDLASVQKSRGIDGNDYDAESLSTTIAPYYDKIIKLLLEHAANRKIIVFLPLIKSSEAFAAIARAHGIQAVHVDGKSPDRDEILEGYRRGRIQMLCNANVVETGVDLPNADCFVNLRPTKSAVRYQQSFGRVMRVLPGVIDHIPGRHQAAERRAAIAASAKPNALIIDFLWQHDALGVYRPENMVANSAEEAQAIYEKVKKELTPADILRIQKLVQEEREALVVKRLEQVAYGSGGAIIEPAQFGRLIGSMELMSYEPRARWEMEPASPAQISRLREYGIDTDKVTGKGMASALISHYSHRVRFRLANVKQLQALEALGVKFNPLRMTMREAGRLITEAKVRQMRRSSFIDQGCTCSTSPMPPCGFCESGARREKESDAVPF